MEVDVDAVGLGGLLVSTGFWYHPAGWTRRAARVGASPILLGCLACDLAHQKSPVLLHNRICQICSRKWWVMNAHSIPFSFQGMFQEATSRMAITYHRAAYTTNLHVQICWRYHGCGKPLASFNEGRALRLAKAVEDFHEGYHPA